MPTFMYTLFKTPHAAVWIYCSFFSKATNYIFQKRPLAYKEWRKL